MTDREAQKAKILHFMEAGNIITDAIARDLFDCSRVGARIWDLRQDGVPVQDEFEYKVDGDGKVVKKWKKYWIPRSAPQRASL